MANAKTEAKKPVSKNWRSKTASELKRMCPQQKARYLAYEEPPKDVQKEVVASRKRVSAWLIATKGGSQVADPSEEAKMKQRNTLIGQLKAAEARNRIREMRLRYQSIRSQEINVMVSCQSTAQNAIRLQLLLPVKDEKVNVRDILDKLERERVEEILEDERGLTICRR